MVEWGLFSPWVATILRKGKPNSGPKGKTIENHSTNLPRNISGLRYHEENDSYDHLNYQIHKFSLLNTATFCPLKFNRPELFYVVCTTTDLHDRRPVSRTNPSASPSSANHVCFCIYDYIVLRNIW